MEFVVLTCDKCGNQIPQAVKFCPHCGDLVTEADQAANTSLSSGVSRAEISFAHSSSNNYPAAVDLCSKLPTYVEQGNGKDKTHKVTLDVTELELIINIWELVGNWKSSQLLLDGQRATKSNLVYKGLGCYRDRQKSFNPQQYCFGENEYDFNFWGCRRLGMPLQSWSEWLTFGLFDAKGVWHFDKARIKHELDLALHEYRFCPVLQPAQVYATLDKLPNTIDPKTDKNWTYRTAYRMVDGDYKEVAEGIEPILKRAHQYVVGDFRPSVPAASEGSTRQTFVAEVTIPTPKTSGAPTPRQQLPGTQKRHGRLGAGRWLLWGVIGLIVLLIAVNL